MSKSARLIGAVARRARRLPFSQTTFARVASRIQTSSTARKIVSRLFDFDDQGRSTVFLNAGNLLGGAGVDNLPIVLVSLLGASKDRASDLIDEVAQEQLLTAGFRPVIVVDSDQFANVRQYGWPIEYVLSEADWQNTDVRWEDYVAQR